MCTRRWRNAGACKRDQSWAWRLPSLGFGTVQSRKYPVAVLDAIRVALLLFEGQSLFSMQRDFSLEILFSAFQTLTCKKARQRNDGHGEACRGWAIVRCTFKFNLYSTSTNHRCVVSHPPTVRHVEQPRVFSQRIHFPSLKFEMGAFAPAITPPS